MAKIIPFTEKQIHELETNKYTHSVSENQIVFTLEFKQFFLDQVVKYHKTAPAILREAGYDTSIFTRSHIDSIRKRILQEANSETGLKPPRGLSTEEKIAAFEAKNLAKQSMKVSIKELQEKVVYLEKQVEFLKKISHLRDPKDQS